MEQPVHEQARAKLIALPPDAAARLAGISTRRLAYWRQKGLITPSIEHTFSQRNTVRLYQFPELVELLVAAKLREDLTLQHIRRVVTYLREQGYSSPLRELCYAVDGDELYIKYPDGSWVGDRRPKQTVQEQVLKLEPIAARVHEAAKRRPEEFGRVTRRRGVMGGQETIAGTRVPVATVRQRLERGQSTAQILASFPALTEADVHAVARQRAAG